MNAKTDTKNNPDRRTILDDRLEIPKRYKVILFNDDYTTMDFVVFILKSIFNKSHDDANRIMLEVHNNGFGICGVFTKEIAETKVMKVHKEAKNAMQPLKCTMELE